MTPYANQIKDMEVLHGLEPIAVKPWQIDAHRFHS